MGTHITKTEEERRKALLAEVIEGIDEILLAGRRDHVTPSNGIIFIEDDAFPPRWCEVHWTLGDETVVLTLRGNNLVCAARYPEEGPGDPEKISIDETIGALEGMVIALRQKHADPDDDYGGCDYRVRPCHFCGKIHNGAGAVILAASFMPFDQGGDLGYIGDGEHRP